VDSRSDVSEPGGAPQPIGADFIVPVLALSLAAYYIISTEELVWEARAAGLVIGIPLVAMCLAHLGRMGFAIATGRATFGTGDLFQDNLFNRQRLALAVLGVMFIATIEWVGTTLGLFLLLIGSMLALGVRDVRVLLGIAIGTAATVYVLLILVLGSRLPQGPVEWLLGRMIGGS
jgi:hypothetical protein